MTDGPRRRRGRLLIPLLGVGVAAWAARRRLGDRPNLDAGWELLPPAPVPPAARPVPPVVAETPAVPSPVAPAEPAPARAVPVATAVASVTAPALPDAPHGPGSLRALADGSSPDPDYAVKGKSATKVFHAPGGPYYTRTRADVWFRSADDARVAGFTERTRRHS